MNRTPASRDTSIHTELWIGPAPAGHAAQASARRMPRAGDENDSKGLPLAFHSAPIMFPFEPGSRSVGIKTLVCASLLVCVPTAMPQVTAIGSECHRAQVGDAVARVRARSPEVARMLDELEEAKYACRVVRRTSGPSTVDTDAKQVTIGWPGRSGTYADGSCIDPDANLVHEAYHCWVRSKNEGFEPCTSVPTRTVSGALVVAAASCEFDAVRFENRYRKAIGLCERLTYDIFEVPGAERTCRAAEAACTPGVAACK